MHRLATVARPELEIEPRLEDYAEAPIAETFDWLRIVRFAREHHDLVEGTPLYLVVFRSRLKEGVDTTSLLEHDTKAHVAAMESPALIHYFADEPDELGRALSFCLWTDREEARRVSMDSRHTAAASMVIMYASYSIEKYDVHHDTEDVILTEHAAAL